MAERAELSVVIPAHNEAAGIARCLSAVMEQAHELAEVHQCHVEVVVAANGCTDDTVAIARRFEPVTVLDLENPGKIGALNAGDAVARHFPRIYLDADVELGPGTLAALREALDVDEPRVASPPVAYQVLGCSWPVRAFYRVFEQLPSAAGGIAGHGIFAVSRAGRQRFGNFPDVQSDDLFVARLFSPSESLRSAGESRVWPARRLRSLLAVRTRIAQGNAQLAGRPRADTGDFSRSTGSTIRALVQLVTTNPGLIPAAAVFAAVNLMARLRARWGSAQGWHRDHSTR